MRVVLGSENKPKAKSVSNAFQEFFGVNIDLELVKVDSGVSNHPTSAEESLLGAVNRVKNAKQIIPDADYYVGIEGGLLRVGKMAWELGWVAIMNSDDVLHTGLSSGLEIKDQILDKILQGSELSEILEEFYGLKDLGQREGYFGLTTQNIITRERSYTEAIIFALAPFKNPQYFS